MRTNPQPKGTDAYSLDYWHTDQACLCKALVAQYSPAPGSAYRRALVRWANSHGSLVGRHGR